MTETTIAPVSTQIAEAASAHLLLAAIVQNSDDAIISKNLDGIIMSWNSAATRIFGYEPHEIIGKSILTLIPPDLHQEEVEIIGRIKAGLRVDHYETVRRTKTGDLVEVSLTVSPVRDANGIVIGASKIARDISARRQMERTLIQSEKLAATGRMAATIAHEINNPLESVVNLLYLTRSACDSNRDALEYLEIAEREIERVSHIARQTLGFYRDTGTAVDVSLQSVMESTLRVYQRKMLERQIAVQTYFPDDSTVRVKRGDMAQVFSNLVSNAIDAMPHGGDLMIRIQGASISGKKAFEIEVSDSGSGISEEHLSRVFEPFFSTKGDLGTGIGLWIAKQLAEGYGGSVSISSNTAENHGTSVRVLVPAE